MAKDGETPPKGSTIVYWCEEHGVSIWEPCCGRRGPMGYYESSEVD